MDLSKVSYVSCDPTILIPGVSQYIYSCRPLSNTNDWHIYSTSLSSDSTKVAMQILRPRSSVMTHA